MKIFGWIHHKSRDNRRYALVSLSKVAYEDEDHKLEVARNKAEDKQSLLLEKAGIVETLQGWHDGILSIGTFGFDEITPVEDDEPTPNPDEAKKRGLHVAMAKLELNKEEPIEKLGSNPEERLGLTDIETQRLALLQASVESIEEEAWSEKKEEKKRTTLADLFSRQDVHDKPVPGSGAKEVGVEDGRKKKQACQAKSGEAISEGKYGSKGHEPGPSTKIHKLVAKMMKRKIHPDAADSVKDSMKAKDKETIEDDTSGHHDDGKTGTQKALIFGDSSQRSEKSRVNKVSIM